MEESRYIPSKTTRNPSFSTKIPSKTTRVPSFSTKNKKKSMFARIPSEKTVKTLEFRVKKR